MTDFILDDINQLLVKDRGDRKILEQIKRAAERGEVISIHERHYVQNLVEKHLRKKPIIAEEIKPTIPKETNSIPPIEMKSNQTQAVTKSQWSVQKTRRPIFESKIKNEKTTKIAFALGGIALAIILVVGLTQTGIPNLPENVPLKPSILDFEIKTDLNSYTSSDIISISGKSKISLGTTAELTIRNAQDKTIWQEIVKIKETGTFSTLAIAGGVGWENSGEYVLLARHGNEQFQTSFNFKK